jgi:hypothetical protein
MGMIIYPGFLNEDNRKSPGEFSWMVNKSIVAFVERRITSMQSENVFKQEQISFEWILKKSRSYSDSFLNNNIMFYIQKLSPCSEVQ